MGVTTEEKPTYDFGISGNSYFQGNDGLVTRGDGKSIRIRYEDNLIAVNVKDHSFGVFDVLDDEHKAKLKELNEHAGTFHMPWGDTGTFEDWLYERCREQWWHDAEWFTGGDSIGSDPERPTWTNDVYSAGRQGGWCVIKGTESLAEHGFPTDEWTEAEQQRLDHLAKVYDDPNTSADEWDELRDEHDTLIERKDLLTMRDEFLTLAFALVDNIKGVKTGWGVQLIEERFDELEEARERNIVRGDN